MLATVEDYIEAGITHSIHTSGRKSYRGCRRRWDWIFNDFYYPKTTAKPLEFGVAYHKAMEVYYNPETWFIPHAVRVELAITAFVDVCNKQRMAFIEATGGIDHEQEQDYKERVELGKGMLNYHLREVAPRLDSNLTPIKVEIPFEVPITNPDTGEELWCKCNTCWSRWDNWINENKCCDDPTNQCLRCGSSNGWKGLPVTYGGRIDAIVQDAQGRIWIVDWKTAARLSTDNDSFLLLDDQISSYVWALRLLGIDVAGFIYHEQKKAFPQPPEPNVRPRLGRIYSVSKSQNTTPELYRETVSENDPVAYDAGLYDEFIDHLLNNAENVYYDRKQIHRGEREMVEIQRNIFLEASEMTDPNLRIYPNPGRFGCNYCAFREPCQSKNEGSDYVYTLVTLFDKRRHHYWEDKVPSTESKGGE